MTYMVHGKSYKDRAGDRWVDANYIGSYTPQFTATREKDGAICNFNSDGTFCPSGRSKYPQDNVFDLVEELRGEPVALQSALRAQPSTATRRIALAVAGYADIGDVRLSLIVAGKNEDFVISRSAAASMIGRVADILANPVDHLSEVYDKT